jgi:hypothetical protein
MMRCGSGAWRLLGIGLLVAVLTWLDALDATAA